MSLTERIPENRKMIYAPLVQILIIKLVTALSQLFLCKGFQKLLNTMIRVDNNSSAETTCSPLTWLEIRHIGANTEVHNLLCYHRRLPSLTSTSARRGLISFGRWLHETRKLGRERRGLCKSFVYREAKTGKVTIRVSPTKSFYVLCNLSVQRV